MNAWTPLGNASPQTKQNLNSNLKPHHAAINLPVKYRQVFLFSPKRPSISHTRTHIIDEVVFGIGECGEFEVLL